MFSPGKTKTSNTFPDFFGYLPGIFNGAVLQQRAELISTQAGYDIDLLQAISGRVRITVIDSGGAGKMEQLY